MIPEPVLRLFPRLGIYILASRGEELQFCCPFCEKNGKPPDTQFHLYLRIGEKKLGHACKSCVGHFVCHRCGVRGRTLEQLYARLGLVYDDEPAAPDNVLELVHRLLAPQGRPSSAPLDIGFPDDYRPVEPDSLAYRYALSRGLTPDEIVAYELGFGTGPLSWRLIIPNRSETGVDMWQARWYHPLLPNKIKYKTPSGVQDSLVLFNRLRAAKHRIVIVCEGPISAMVAGPMAVASWGKHLSATQVELLLRMNAEEYWIAYDGDAVLAGLAAASTLYSRGRKVRFLRLPSREDPASLGRDAVHHLGQTTQLFTELTPALVMVGAA